MSKNDILSRSLCEHIFSLEKKEYSSLELTLAYLENIESKKELNAYITVCAEQALKEAKAADARIASNARLSSLDGIPYAAKDNISAKDVRLTCASKILENYVAPYDATVVELLRRNGAILLGKTNLDEFAMGTGSENSYFGRVKNPLDATRVPGGSSGGSAAAVAAHLCAFALGSDTGGSVRQPAAFCGVVGLRPTYSLVSRYGLVGFAPSLDTVGILTQNVGDCAKVLDVIAKKDDKDATSLKSPADSYKILPEYSLVGKKIAIVKELCDLSLSQKAQNALRKTANAFIELGATVCEISLPSLFGAYASYYTISSAEASSNLSRFDGVRFGHRAENAKALDELYKRSRSEGLGHEVKRRILFGSAVLCEDFKNDLYCRALAARSHITEELTNALREVDILLCPTASGEAYRACERKDELFDAYTKDDILCVPASLAGLPSISLPFFDEDPLPVGIQLVANRFCENELLCTANALLEATREE